LLVQDREINKISVPSKRWNNGVNILNEPVATTASLVLLLQLNKFKLAERFEDVLKITFSNAEMYVAYV